MKKIRCNKRAISRLLSAVAAIAITTVGLTQSVQAKFMNTAVIWNSNVNKTEDYADAIAPYDLIWTTRMNSKNGDGWCGDHYGCIWEYLYNKNPDLKIFLYISPLEVNRTHDTYDVIALNDLGRYQNARGHSMGTIDSHQDFYLRNENGEVISRTDSLPDWLELDGGNITFQEYLKEVLATDIIDNTEQQYVADGLCFDSTSMVFAGNRSQAEQYSTEDDWGDMMIDFISSQAEYLHSRNQLLWTNSGVSHLQGGYNNWIKWANSDNITYPDYVLDEPGFCAHYGSADFQFYPPADWKRAIDGYVALTQKTNVVCNIPLGTYWRDNASGTDNYGDTLTRDDIFEYVFTSWALAKNNNLYLSMHYANGDDPYHEIMREANKPNGKLNLGTAIGDYYTREIDGVTLYLREFTEGYVIVNPSTISITNPFTPADLGINSPVKRIRFDQLNEPMPHQLTEVINELPRHRGIVLRKYKNPTNISNLKLWLDASDEDTVFTDTACTIQAGNGDEIACWKDKSGNIDHVIQSDSSKRPVFEANGNGNNNDDHFNDNGVIVFNKSEEDHLIKTLANPWSGNSTVFIVFEETSAGNQYDSIFSNGTLDDQENDYQMCVMGSGNERTFKVLTTMSSGEDLDVDFESAISNVVRLHTIRFNDSGIETAVNGMRKDFEANTNNGRTYSQYRINVNRGGFAHLDSKIAEIIVYDKALNDDEMRQIFKYLENKYNKDFLIPEMTLRGNNPDNVVVNSTDTYQDPGINCVDNMSGRDSLNISSTSDVDMSTPGTYFVEYTCTDEAGLSDTRVRIVNVIEANTRTDVNNDSQTNSTDALLTLRHSLGLSMTDTDWQESSITGDANCDGTTNSTDALLILRYSLGLDMNGTGWCGG